MKKYSTVLILSLSLLYALVGPIFAPTVEIFWLVSALVAVIAILSKQWVDFLLVLFVQLNMLAHLYMFPALSDFRHIAQVTAFSGYLLLCLTLMMGPLARFTKFFAKHLKHRRHVGVSVFLLGLVHALFVVYKYYDLDPTKIYAVKSNYFGGAGLIIFTALALTSTDYALRKFSLKVYSLIHTSFLAFFLAYSSFVAFFTEPPFQTWALIVIAVLTIFWILLSPWTLPKKLFKVVNGWKQLHYLVYIAFIAVAIHAWTGFFVIQTTTDQVIFWVATSATVALQTAGLVMRFYLNSKKNDNRTK